jgi:hypothetical protein
VKRGDRETSYKQEWKASASGKKGKDENLASMGEENLENDWCT